MSKVLTRRTGEIPPPSLRFRDVSFKARVRHNYGCNEQTYEELVKYKHIWQKSLFYVDEDSLAKGVANGNLQTKPVLTLSDLELNLPDPVVEPIDNIDHEVQLSILVTKGKDSKDEIIEYEQSIQINPRNGVLAFSGGQITSMSWLPKPLNNFDDYLYLAVSVIYNPKGLHDSVISPQLSMFPKNLQENCIKSSVQIWKYSLTNNSAQVVKTYDVSNIGASSNLQWLQIYTKDSSSLGVLIGAFTDGKVHLIKISMNDTKYVKVIESSLTYTAPGGTDEASIVCFDTFGYNKLMVGMSNGCIAEYVLPYMHFDESVDLDVSVPSYIFRVETSSVSSVMVAEPETGKFLVVVNTTGYQGLVYEYDNFIQGRTISLSVRNVIKPVYNHALKVYLSTMPDSVYYNYIRTAQEKSNSLLKCDAFITSSSLSDILSHPLNISGTSDGDVILVDYARKILNGTKTTKKVLVPLKLWKLKLIDGKLILVSDFEPTAAEPPTQSPVSPPEVIFSGVSWNENIVGSSIYAAGTTSGLFIIERLDPSKGK
jgi:transcription factor C subunit 6